VRLQNLFLIFSQGVDLGLLAIAAAFRAARDLKKILGSGFEIIRIRISQCESPRVFGFMIKKGQIGDQIQDYNRGELACHPKLLSLGFGNKCRETSTFFRIHSVWSRSAGPESTSRNEDSVLLPSDRVRRMGRSPIIGTRAELRFVSAHCHGRLGGSGCAEADAGSGILLW
jgi:hypothetical protein